MRGLIALTLLCAWASAGSIGGTHTRQVLLRASVHGASSLPLRPVIRLRGGSDGATATADASAAAVPAAPAKVEPEVVDPAQAAVRSAIDVLRNK